MVFFQFAQPALVILFTKFINPSGNMIPTLLKGHGIAIRNLIYEIIDF